MQFETKVVNGQIPVPMQYVEKISKYANTELRSSSVSLFAISLKVLEE